MEHNIPAPSETEQQAAYVPDAPEAIAERILVLPTVADAGHNPFALLLLSVAERVQPNAQTGGQSLRDIFRRHSIAAAAVPENANEVSVARGRRLELDALCMRVIQYWKDDFTRFREINEDHLDFLEQNGFHLPLHFEFLPVIKMFRESAGDRDAIKSVKDFIAKCETSFRGHLGESAEGRQALHLLIKDDAPTPNPFAFLDLFAPKLLILLCLFVLAAIPAARAADKSESALNRVMKTQTLLCCYNACSTFAENTQSRENSPA